MSSGPWENNEPGIFGGHSKGSWTSGQDVPGAGPMDGDSYWSELEKEYYEDFDRRIATPVHHQYKYEGQPNGENQAGKSARRTHKHVREERYHGQGTEANGKPYNEEIMKVTDVRRGGQKRQKNPFANGSSSSFSGGTKIAPYSKSVNCPESGCEVCFSDCLRCENFQQWHEDDDGLRRCYHEYMDLESRGYYDGTWNDQPGQYTYEEWVQYQEELRRNDVIDSSEMEREWSELEREDEEFEKRAEEMERKADSEYDEYLKDKYGDQEDEGDHEEEEEEEDEDEKNEHEKENDKDEDEVEDDYGEEDYFDDDQDDGYDYGDGWRG
jgi:hypothetical protein